MGRGDETWCKSNGNPCGSFPRVQFRHCLGAACHIMTPVLGLLWESDFGEWFDQQMMYSCQASSVPRGQAEPKGEVSMSDIFGIWRITALRICCGCGCEIFWDMLWTEEILHHLGCIKPSNHENNGIFDIYIYLSYQLMPDLFHQKYHQDE